MGRTVIATKSDRVAVRPYRRPLFGSPEPGTLERLLGTSVYRNRREVASTGTITAAEVDGFMVGGRRKLRGPTTRKSSGQVTSDLTGSSGNQGNSSVQGHRGKGVGRPKG